VFIVIEGIDGAGKGTHTKRLEAELTGMGVDACSKDCRRVPEW